MISINDTKINQIKSIRESYQTLELYLDSTLIKTNNTLKKSTHKASISTKTLKKEKLVKETKVDSSLIKRNIKVLDSITTYINTLEMDSIDPIEKKETIKKQRKLSREEYRNQAEAIKPYFFNEITRIYYNIKKPRNIRENDNHIWIEINSENGNYKNSLKNIIHNITINNVSLPINNIEENIKRSPTGYMSTYYIQVKVPKGLINQRNQLIITADRDYIKWFIVIID